MWPGGEAGGMCWAGPSDVRRQQPSLYIRAAGSSQCTECVAGGHPTAATSFIEMGAQPNENMPITELSPLGWIIV